MSNEADARALEIEDDLDMLEAADAEMVVRPAEEGAAFTLRSLDEVRARFREIADAVPKQISLGGYIRDGRIWMGNSLIASGVPTSLGGGKEAALGAEGVVRELATEEDGVYPFQSLALDAPGRDVVAGWRQVSGTQLLAIMDLADTKYGKAGAVIFRDVEVRLEEPSFYAMAVKLARVEDRTLAHPLEIIALGRATRMQALGGRFGESRAVSAAQLRIALGDDPGVVFVGSLSGRVALSKEDGEYIELASLNVAVER